jgi:hypothetical protein
MDLDTVVSGCSAGKRRRNDDDRNDRNSKRSAVMRRGYARQEKEVGVTWELVGLAMEQVAVKWNTTGRVAGIGTSVGKEGGMGRSGQIGGGGKRGVLIYIV